MKNWQRYSEYKDSGVEWLGEIPKHWEVKRLKTSAGINLASLNDNTHPEYLLRYIDIGNVNSNGYILESQEFLFKKSPTRARRKVQHGDIIISTVRTYLRAISLIENPPTNLIVSTGFAVLTPKVGIYSNFLFRLIQSYEFIERVVAYSEGVGYPAINPSKLACLPIWLPSLSEQKSIAHFLDHETSKLDKLIAKKQRFIELLQEKRTALISHAVTKGLNPDIPMKDSGISWLGQIPKHWEVMKLKRTANIRYGLGQPPPETINGTPLIRATNIKNGFISQNDMLYVDINKVPESRNAILSPGEIIVVRSGAYTGDSAIIPPKYAGAIAGYDMVVRPIRCESQFLAWQFLSLQIRYLQFSFHMLRAAQPHLNAEELKETIITFPSLSEQKAIAHFLDQETAKIDTLIEKTKTSIEKLKEYRTALISAAVTGKIDIREEI